MGRCYYDKDRCRVMMSLEREKKDIHINDRKRMLMVVLLVVMGEEVGKRGEPRGEGGSTTAVSCVPAAEGALMRASVAN